VLSNAKECVISVVCNLRRIVPINFLVKSGESTFIVVALSSETRDTGVRSGIRTHAQLLLKMFYGVSDLLSSGFISTIKIFLSLFFSSCQISPMTSLSRFLLDCGHCVVPPPLPLRSLPAIIVTLMLQNT
jgi:hypothetical protein